MNEVMVRFIIILGLLTGFLLFYFMTSCTTSDCEKEITRREVEQNFLKNEQAFSDFISYFNSLLPKNKRRIVRFGLGDNKSVNLTIRPFANSITKGNGYIGGENLKLNDPKLDSVLSELKWTTKNVIALKEKLSKISCEWIGTTEIYQKPIEIFYKKSGWGSFSYLVFETPLTDSLIKMQGNPISTKGYGNRVVISYTSAL